VCVSVCRWRRVKEAVLWNCSVGDCGADTRRECSCAVPACSCTRGHVCRCVGVGVLVRVMISLCNDTSCLTTSVTSTHLYSYPCLIAPPHPTTHMRHTHVPLPCCRRGGTRGGGEGDARVRDEPIMFHSCLNLTVVITSTPTAVWLTARAPTHTATTTTATVGPAAPAAAAASPT
jgi:hypothetical protein